MKQDNKYIYTPLIEPISITEQEWPEGTLPLAHIRTMTYMHESYIRDCIEGILMQKTTFPVQVLIHDDASTDKTAEIVREYEQKYPCLIKVYYQKENSFSKTDKHERRAEFTSWRIGKYEALCEGDDYWTDPLKLQKQVDFLEKHEEYGLVYSSFITVNENSEKINLAQYETMKKKAYSGFVFFELLAKGNRILTCSVCYRNELKSDSFDCFIYDYWLYLDIARKAKVQYSEEDQVAYRVHQASLMRSNKSFTAIRTHLVRMDMINRYFKFRDENYLNNNRGIGRSFWICFRHQILYHKGKYTKKYLRILVSHFWLIKYVFYTFK